ncbi:MAG: isocitrate/isopropylmalate family dehydrogenase, partial [Nitrospinota bacterium]|nr:isocitrate/isopropylmalate family dehydrogenase [Nitrospinota bacterium]
YIREGRMMPDDALDTLATFDAIYFGAVGHPEIQDHVTLNGLLLPIRRTFDQYVCERPSILYPGVTSPLRDKGPSDIDMVVIRENTEGKISSRGEVFKEGTPDEVTVYDDINTYKGIERVCRYSFEYARSRGYPKVSMTDKGGGVGIWYRVFWEVAEKYPDVEAEHIFIDTLCAELLRHPDSYSVIVTNDIFGDILSDLCAGLVGGMGMAASGCIHPGRVCMFEPVHGTAPDICFQDKANPFAAVLTGRILLDTLGHRKASELIWEAVRLAVKEDKLTGDLGGKLGTRAVGDCLVETVEKLAKEGGA